MSEAVSEAVQSAALLCTVLGLLSAGMALVVVRDGQLAVKVVLDFLLAAGLLRLADDPTLRAVGTAALVVALRRVVSYDLRRAHAARS